MLRVPLDAIVERLVSSGLDREGAEGAVREIEAHPAIGAGRFIASRLRKTEKLLELVQQLARTAPDGELDQPASLDASTFWNTYYTRNQAVVLRGAAASWPALSKWSPSYLAQNFGDVEVEITTRRQSDPQYELNFRQHTSRMSLREFAGLVADAGATNDFYMVANNKVLQHTRLGELLHDVGDVCGTLDPAEKPTRTFLWFGPAGTVTPLHHDRANIFMAQVFGRKRVSLFPTHAIRHMYNNVGVFSPGDPEDAASTLPALQHAKKYVVVLSPGDVLFLPVGWWHHVRSLDTSITVSMDNFAAQNTFDWAEPEPYL
jgi:hypothetical protein